MSALYIHIPFCLGKCDYCSFNSYAGMESSFARYVDALVQEIEHQATNRQEGALATIFFGGGTPSILPGHHIERILAACHEVFGISENAEITIEINPKTVDFMRLLHLRQAGVNRLSLGIQSFIDSELNLLGRLHSAQDGWNCVRDALGAGFINISLDLMYGIPQQSVAMWRWNLETALSLEITHLSLYQLTVEEGTRFAEKVARKELILPDEDTVIQMDEVTSELCTRHGLKQYEISNFAREGYVCRHNINYWHNLEYLALGAGAVRYQDGVRSRNISHPLKYCEAVERGGTLIEESETLSREESFRESVIIGLRMLEGISQEELLQRYDIDFVSYYGPVLTDLIDNGFLELNAAYLRLTGKGRRLANQILARLV